MWSGRLLTLVLLVLEGCGRSTGPLIQKLTPLSGSTSQDLDLAPVLVAGEGASIDANDRRVVLYDVTGGARQTVVGDIEILGSQFTYRPSQPLTSKHDFELTIEQSALSGSALDEMDASESPQEPISWPLRWGFSTSPLPRVRAAYFDRAYGAGRLTIRFSQPMEARSTGSEIKVLDWQGVTQEVGSVVWPDTATTQLDLVKPLDTAQVYRLQVGATALGANGLRLDGDGNAVGGESSDAFSAAFTGSQRIILSRQRPAPTVP